jgi:SAM-dependent methyltransferase
MAKTKRQLTAATADPYWLYQESVQNPDWTVPFLERVFRSRVKRKPLVLREDFCGTAYLATEWVRSHPRRRAVGIDIDPKPLAWGRKHNLSRLGPDAERVRLVQGDVRDGDAEVAQIVAAFNFSYWCFLERQVLRSYFRSVREGLSEPGVFVIDLHGGPDAQYELEESTKQRGYKYVWGQGMLDALTHVVDCSIHFDFPDGSRLDHAFTYHWRLWSLPELRDILADAGFSRIDAWWEVEDDKYRRRRHVDNTEAWVAYLAAWR